ncbi:4-hydroxy-4-methyl-2-oxoglutarate aldolase [Sporomusa ovata DSM 2662]|uniref:RraA family protein n=1 Tax=Sporomusa ovata TaxID=2378 RepID=UPI0003887930|nr:dimethylmenaquinone methyltransferase [Sporomusa ovata DSM 2662]
MSNVGMRIFLHISRPPKALIDGFAGLPVANIADNMNRMSCMDAKIRPINDVPLLGPAFTVKSRPGDNLLLHKALDLAQPGDIVVVDAQGDLTNSIMGELMALWAKQRGIGGFIIDGAIRDIGALKKWVCLSMRQELHQPGLTKTDPENLMFLSFVAELLFIPEISWSVTRMVLLSLTRVMLKVCWKNPELNLAWNTKLWRIYSIWRGIAPGLTKLFESGALLSSEIKGSSKPNWVGWF